jgi:hypothetical protein
VKNPKPAFASRIFALRQYLLNKVPYKIIFLVTGILATLWFLVRVIPKPSRAGYPCMQAAAPIMSGFVLYLISFTGSFFAIKKAKTLLGRKSYLPATAFLLVGLVMGVTFFVITNTRSDARANITVMTAPPDGANNPMGIAQGIFPGRVIWAWNPDAISPDCANVPGNAFWDYKNNDTLVIRKMVEQSLLMLTGTHQLENAWDSIFYNHNRKKHEASRGYQQGEKIYIKINQGTARWILDQTEKNNGYAWPTSGTISPPWRRDHFAASETGPFVVLNILRQLVNVAGVPQENIAVGDPMSNTFKHNYAVWHNEFPNVKYTDKFSDNHNRTYIQPADGESMTYSDKGNVMPDAKKESYFTIMEEADYLINVACLKPHLRAGVTMGAKNHFGSITKGGAEHLHPSLVYPEEVNDPSIINQGYNKYRVAVDIMGHKYLGGNTMLFVLEALLGGGPSEIKQPVKYNMFPFNGNWSNSIFMSLDQVAIESVGYDFLREEFNGINQPEDYPNWLGVDDYLHQAADQANWPTDITYNPDGSGTLKSLGVHEHWNNATDKQYSRNLGSGEGIELLSTNGFETTPVNNILLHSKDILLSVYPNPAQSNMPVTIKIDLPELGVLNLRIYDMQGRMVAQIENGFYTQGVHEINFALSSTVLSPGIYMIRAQFNNKTNNYLQTHKIQIIK